MDIRKGRWCLFYLWASTVLWENRQCRIFTEGEAIGSLSINKGSIVQSNGL